MTPPELDELVEPVPPAEEPAGAGSGVRGWTIGLALMIVVVIGAVFAVVIALSGGSDDAAVTATAEQDLTYVVPAGTGDRIDAGEKVEVIPQQIVIHVDQTLVLVNEDDRTHNLGGYYVRAGETMRVNYPRPGLYMNSCSVNSGALVYVHVVA